MCRPDHKGILLFPRTSHNFCCSSQCHTIAVTTGVDPHGKKTLHIQPIDNPQPDITDQIQTVQDALNHAQAQRTSDDVRGSQSPLEKENLFSNMQIPVSKKGRKASPLSQETFLRQRSVLRRFQKSVALKIL